MRPPLEEAPPFVIFLSHPPFSNFFFNFFSLFFSCPPSHPLRAGALGSNDTSRYGILGRVGLGLPPSFLSRCPDFRVPIVFIAPPYQRRVALSLLMYGLPLLSTHPPLPCFPPPFQPSAHGASFRNSIFGELVSYLYSFFLLFFTPSPPILFRVFSSERHWEVRWIT